MGDKSRIEWTDATWNPVVGCSKVSPGCDNCYAIPMSRRIEATGNEAYQGITTHDDWTGLVKTLPERLDQPLRWQKPRRVFVNSMSDLFHPDVPFDFVFDVIDVMARASQHQFQVLTKRPHRMRRMVTVIGTPPNVWWGTSIESDKYTFRARHLAETPAAVRFLSLEPLLGPLPSLDLEGIDWVIVGGESGPGARPMHPEWVRAVRDQCVEAGVSFFFKQWGAWGLEAPTDAEGRFDFSGGHTLAYDGTLYGPDDLSWPDGQRRGEAIRSDRYQPAYAVYRVGKKTAGRELDGRTWGEYPEVVQV